MEQIEVRRGEPGCTAGSVLDTKQKEADRPKTTADLYTPSRNAYKRTQRYVLGDRVICLQNQARDKGGESSSAIVTGEDGICAWSNRTDGDVIVEVHYPSVQQRQDPEAIPQTINKNPEVQKDTSKVGVEDSELKQDIIGA